VSAVQKETSVVAVLKENSHFLPTEGSWGETRNASLE